jgi:hypothetical protein
MTGECYNCGSQMLGRAPSFATTNVLVWPNFTFVLPPVFGLLEPAQISATTRPILHFCYKWRFGLLEPASIFATTGVSIFARTSPSFAFLLPPFLVLLEPAQKFATTAVGCEPWRRHH